MLVSITGLTVSGVSFPSTTAVFFISPESFTTSTVNETVTELFLDTSTVHEIFSFSTIPSFEIEFSTNFVPSGIISEILTFLASISALLLVAVISYVILLPSCTALSFSFNEFNFATLLISNTGLLVFILIDICALDKSILFQATVKFCVSLSSSLSIISVCVYSSFGNSASSLFPFEVFWLFPVVVPEFVPLPVVVLEFDSLSVVLSVPFVPSFSSFCIFSS